MFTQDIERSTLIQQILSAKSQDEVMKLIDASIKWTRTDLLGDSGLRSFVDRTLNEIRQSDPLSNSAEQWSNLKMAKIYFNRILRGFSEPAYNRHSRAHREANFLFSICYFKAGMLLYNPAIY